MTQSRPPRSPTSAGGRRSPRPPLDPAALEELALDYAARYATTRAKLAAYLRRKLAERGWAGEGAPPLADLVERLARNRFVDDSAFAEARSAALGRRGYGARRVRDALHAAGVGEEDGALALEAAAARAWDSALAYARRRRAGPFAERVADRDSRERLLAAFARAGHDLALARRILAAPPGQVPERDES